MKVMNSTKCIYEYSRRADSMSGYIRNMILTVWLLTMTT